MKKWLSIVFLCVPVLMVTLFSGTVAEKTKMLDTASFTEMFQPDESHGQLVVESMDLYPVNRSDLQTGDRQEEYLCIWSSLQIIPDPLNESCEVHLETTDWLCSPVPGILSTGTAVYRANETKVQDYLVMGSVYWGFLPGLPPGWCWILMVDYSWGDKIPFMPNTYWLDRASAYNHGPIVPPIQGFCGWPLSEPPPPFLFHCP